ncbi:MAG TPA: hypothetical protein DCR40_12840 [Prolixibacteraceae bacterium]|nr:hypothetical protein [Prolixibacteraceae bacterium]
MEILVTLKLVDKVIDRHPEKSRLWVSPNLFDKNNTSCLFSFSNRSLSMSKGLEIQTFALDKNPDGSMLIIHNLILTGEPEAKIRP